MDFKNVKVCKDNINPKNKTVSVNSREIKTAQDFRDFLFAPTNLIENFTKSRAQKSRAGKKSKLCKGIYALAEKLYHEKKPISGQAIFDHIRRNYPKFHECTIGDYQVWWDNGRIYQQNDKTGKMRDISHQHFIKNYVTRIKKTEK